MLFLKLKDRYDLNEKEIGFLVDHILSGKGLFESSELFKEIRANLNKKEILTEELYVIASKVCSEMLGDNIRNLGPNFVKDKNGVNQLKKPLWDEQKRINEITRNIKAIADDLELLLIESI